MDLRQSIAHQTAVGLRLSAAAASKAADANLALSPLSLHIALSLVAAGSKNQTLDQLLSFLAPKGDDLHSLSSQVVQLVLADASPLGGPVVAFANGVFVDASLSLNPQFKEIVTSSYRAEAKPVDFQTKAVEVTNEINSWAEKVTTGLIKELLPPGSVSSTTRLVLSNALYFKGVWTEKFDASATKDSEFHLLNGTTIQAPFMTTTKKQYISAFDGFKVLGLPYKQGEDKRQFSLYIFLPDAKDGIWNLLEKLSSDSEFLNHHLPTRKVEVESFKLPKFKISYGFEASEVLKGLGLTSPFSSNADLSNMVDSSVAASLYVSSIFHKSFIEVNEEGTEAAAASAVVVNLRSLPLPPVDFIADHPFLFVIKEDMTGVVMFTGHVVNPLL